MAGVGPFYIVGENTQTMQIASALQRRGFDIRGNRRPRCWRVQRVCEFR